MTENCILSLRANEVSVAIALFTILLEIASVVSRPRNDILGHPVSSPDTEVGSITAIVKKDYEDDLKGRRKRAIG